MAIEIDKARQDRIVALHADGYTQSAIAAKLGISQGRVSTILKRAREHETAVRSHLDHAQIAQQSADDLGELLTLLARQPRTQRKTDLIRRTLRNYRANVRYAQLFLPDWQPAEDVRACVAQLEREYPPRITPWQRARGSARTGLDGA